MKSGSDLDGPKLGITAPGSWTGRMARHCIKMPGLGPRDVNIIAVGSDAPDVVALDPKKVDALVYFDRIATLLSRKIGANSLFDARTVEGAKTAFGGIRLAPVATCRNLHRQKSRNRAALGQCPAEEPPLGQLCINGAVRGAVPAQYETDREVNIEILKASKAPFSRASLMDAQPPKVPPAVLSGFYPGSPRQAKPSPIASLACGPAVELTTAGAEDTTK
ncbi:hypothetical protein CWO89_34680 [Bradyrhizobium sp. Leo170]|uniref:hypothetical protein n=2 Tax=Bradyrhizobium TaxID=374 RepID=UPI0006859FB4|nr:hypothetical protein [Bradyrhizobium elkanii]RZN16498.1 hypothetical protein CWO90_39540 [Bradyrhizobium sp. Leo121]TAI61521.1 hypothetical protein CWO89_34680 [Bradyrhizobium sp. Leo170]